MKIAFNYPFEKLSPNSFYAKFSFLDKEYKTVLYLDGCDWRKPVIFGCDEFKKLLGKSNGQEKRLIKYLMNVNDPGIAFLLIMQFIHQFGSEEEESIPNSLSLLEEIREIGFDKVLDTNDEFSKLILRLPIDEGNFVSPMTVRILKNQTLEYSLDSFPGYPVAILKDSKKGFLGRILKIATSEYKELRKISEEIFRRIDDEFPTLNPERSSKEILKRRIHCDSSQKEEIEIFYNFKAKQIQINSRDKNNSFNPTNIIEIFTELSRILQANTENQQKDCGICYSSYLDGQVAAFLCKVCGQIYHETCLREWYTSNPECKTVFDKIIGTCLFCDKEIIMKIK